MGTTLVFVKFSYSLLQCCGYGSKSEIWVDRIHVFLGILDPYQIRVADPDLIRIKSGQWIWIRNPVPDPEGQK